ncbi:hypothetical protein [Gluconobacter cerinus]|uniref:hypothetical protein n=1 Tax=Gluconobacter cerinus TaxID=38307 RepID=UPI001B8D4F10|nr:hypothetical protein [Gluconobacter cerinus]MBS1067291.1 hypothetical protein [Gluconobacter cerinus]
MSKVQEWLESGEYLPSFMRDFHDQKDIFKYLDEVRERSVKKNGGSYMANLTFSDAQVYTIDIFLWVMARHGYTLQRSRKGLVFTDLDDTISRANKSRSDTSTAFLKKLLSKGDPA